MKHVKMISLVLITVVGALFSCDNGTLPNTDENTEAISLESLGINSNLDAPVDPDGNPIPEDQNPLRSRIFKINKYSEIVTSGLKAGTETTLIYDDSNVTENNYSTLKYSEEITTIGAWINYPHSVVGADINGNGYDEAIYAYFQPDSGTINVQAETSGTVMLRIVSGASSPYTCRNIVLTKDWKLHLHSTPFLNYMVSMAAADMDGDGKDEIAISVGSNYGIYSFNESDLPIERIQPVFIPPKDENQKFFFRPITVTAGDLSDDGLDDFLFVSGKSFSMEETAKYHLYSKERGSVERIATGQITASQTQTIQFGSAAIGDLDGDGRNDVVFAGDANISGYYRILAARWNGSTLEFISLPDNSMLQYGKELEYLPVNIKAVRVQTGIKKETLFAISYLLVKYEENKFTEVYNITEDNVPLYGCLDAGDVNKDGNDELVVIKRGEAETISIHGLDGSGKWTCLKRPAANADNNGSASTRLVLADLDGDSDVLEYMDHSLRFTDPLIVALVASPPYYEGYPHDVSTSIGTTNSTGANNSHSFSVHAGVSLGFSAESPIWGSLGSAELKSTLTVSLNAGFEYGWEQSVSRGFELNAGEDHVIFQSTPYDCYRYKVLNKNDAEGNDIFAYINTPRSPQLVSMEKNLFNQKTDGVFKLDSEIFPHTIGRPSSYRSQRDMRTYLSDPKSECDGILLQETITPSQGSGSSTISITKTSTAGTTFGGGVSYQVEAETVASCALFGINYGFGYDYSYTMTTSESLEISTSIPFLPANAPDDELYTCGIAIYNKSISKGQAPEIAAQPPAIVVDFWVDQ